MSEVARILRQISEEYDSAQNALIGISCGSARHAFITAKYNHIGELKEEIGKIVGHDNAMILVVEHLNAPDQVNPS